jgi:hypothetical protein
LGETGKGVDGEVAFLSLTLDKNKSGTESGVISRFQLSLYQLNKFSFACPAYNQVHKLQSIVEKSQITHWL